MVLRLAEQVASFLMGASISWFTIPPQYVCLEICPYKDNDAGIQFWEWFVANFSSIKDPLYFTVVWSAKSVRLLVWIPWRIKEYTYNAFYTGFSASEVKMLADVPLTWNYKWLQFSWWCEFYDTQAFGSWENYVDPFREILSLPQWLQEGEEIIIFYEALFDDTIGFRQNCKNIVKNLLKTSPTPEQWWDKEQQKDKQQGEQIKKVWRDVAFSVACIVRGVRDQYRAQEYRERVLHVFDKFVHQWSIRFSSKKQPIRANRSAFINMFHVPTKQYLNTALNYVTYRKLPAPVYLPQVTDHNVTVLGKTDWRWQELSFGIKAEDKFRHIYIVGKTGMGKSTLLSNMVRSDMHAGKWVAILDPHGDLIEDCLAQMPSSRINDVVLFDVSDTSFPVGFNIMEITDPDQKNIVASGVVSTFKKLYGNSRWPRLEYILRNVMLSVLEYPNATLMHVARMLTDKQFREEVLSAVTDPIVVKFWRDEYDKWSDNQRNEAVWPITNKIGQFLSSTIVRNIFAQPKSKINIRKIMDEGKILLINLSKWRIGEDNASMIGSFLVTKFQIDAMSRADIPYDQRKDFYFYIDEFQNFATDSFENILSEARKYRLSLIVANQFTSQIQENVRNAIFWNVGTIVSFWLGYDDATIMSSQFKELITPNDLLSIPKFRAYTRLMVDGLMSDPFSISTYPLPKPDMSEELKAKIRQQSRQRYATEREQLEQLLKVRAQKQFTKSEKIVEKVKAEVKQEQQDGGEVFTIDSVVLGNTYDGYVKLKYNYGLFVTVKGVEWLLHKSAIEVPSNLESRKNIYNIGDKIRVKALEFKEVDGVKRVVWGQK